jgi:hypothetical protein
MIHHPHIDLPPTEAKIFHGMWSELAQLGQLPLSDGVLCPLCLLPKSHDELTLEHIIPRRALTHDPASLRKLYSLSDRSGLTLLCRDCNGLKGRYYDPMIERIFKAPKFSPRPDEEKRVLKARRTLAYLAAFRELGYSYILTSRLDPVRLDFLNPAQPPAATGLYFISGGFYRSFPHAYFDGWCDTYDDDDDNRTNSVFSCHSVPASDTILIRARHVTVMLPAGEQKIILARKPGTSPNTAMNLSLM